MIVKFRNWLFVYLGVEEWSEGWVCKFIVRDVNCSYLKRYSEGDWVVFCCEIRNCLLGGKL